MRVILTNPDTGHTVAVDDWHVEYWQGLGYRAPGRKPAAKKPAKAVTKRAKKKATG